MSTLLLRLSGPLQSWGVQSRFGVRDTGLEPSKSGVLGLLCVAQGRPRHAPLADLAALRMAVRVDQEGRLQRDYHTAGTGGFLRASGDVERDQVVLSSRYYLAGARFLVGLEGDEALLRRLDAALRSPVWPLCLGRKAFPPGEPVWLPDGLRPGEGLLQAVSTYPWLGPEGAPLPPRLRLVVDDPAGVELRPDGAPPSFAVRVFPLRRLSSRYIGAPTGAKEVP